MSDTLHLMTDEEYYQANLRKMQDATAAMTEEDRALVLQAFEYANKAHAEQRRKSGEPYIIHPVSVSCIIAQIGLDVDSVIAGLLHDTIEDTGATAEEIARLFGEPVALLVDGVTRLTKMSDISVGSREEAQMEDLRKMFVAMAKDIRVIIIKLADRLHNMRTSQYWKTEKQQQKALETMEIYTPLAHRLGMQTIKWELEDISLRILDPVGYKEIMDFLDARDESFSLFLDRTKPRIKERVEQAGIPCEVKARLKHVYSIYRKLYGQNMDFAEMYDICATRVIVDKLADCYNVLGLIHDLYRPVPGRFKDYISTPKPNGYQSLHTVVIGQEGIPFEVQIRTKEMDETAEYGVAAHWKYKNGLRGKQNEEGFAWVRQLIETQQDSDAEDFIKNIKTDLFADEVYVFTPRGDVINLPLGANPIDFAYAIHSAVGNRMTGAKVNGRIVPIDYKLKSGEIVDIITAKNATGPKRDWMQLVQTSGARSKIKQWFKKEKREENIAQGKADLDRELRVNLLGDILQNEEILSATLKAMSKPSLDELYAAIGYGGIALSRVVNKIKDEVSRRRAKQEKVAAVLQNSAAPAKKKSASNSGVIVEGLDNCAVKFAKCCHPVPGDDIIGFVTRGFGVSVHRRSCPNVTASMEKDDEYGRWIRTDWDQEERHSFTAALRVLVSNRIGLLADVIMVFTNMKLNITELNTREHEDGSCTLFISTEVSSLEQLDLVMNRVRRVKSVKEVSRNTSTDKGGK